MINSFFNIVPALWTSDQGSYFLYSHSDKVPTLIVIFLFVLFILAALVLVLWIAMPFSVFAIKRQLKRSVMEQKKTNTLLQELLDDKGVREKNAPPVTVKDEPRDF